MRNMFIRIAVNVLAIWLTTFVISDFGVQGGFFSLIVVSVVFGLVNTFIRRLRSRTGKGISGLTPAAMACVMNYHWPGNVRELKSALEFGFVIAENGLIDLDQLPPNIARGQSLPMDSPGLSLQVPGPYEGDGVSMRVAARPHEIAEKEALVQALRQTNGNQSQAARILGINRVTVWNRMKKYGIDLRRVLTI